MSDVFRSKQISEDLESFATRSIGFFRKSGTVLGRIQHSRDTCQQKAENRGLPNYAPNPRGSRFARSLYAEKPLSHCCILKRVKNNKDARRVRASCLSSTRLHKGASNTIYKTKISESQVSLHFCTHVSSRGTSD